MGENNYLVLGAAAAAVVLAAVLLRRFLAGRRPAPAETERDPVPVEGSSAFAGMRRGVKYWIYFEDGEARLELESAVEPLAAFTADARKGRAVLPGDARDHEVRELIRLGALSVEASAETGQVLARFPENFLNMNSGTRFAPRADSENAGRAADLLIALRGRRPAPGA